MNNKKKVILSGILSLVLCISMIAGGTFALFTSESKNNIAITSGKVEVVATITDLSVYSPKEINPADFSYDEKENGSINNTTFANGGTAALEGNKLVISNMTPGDQVKFKVNLENNSNVAIKYQLLVSYANDKGLGQHLVYNINGKAYNNDDVSNTVKSDWTQLYAGQAVGEPIPVEITLPAAVTEQSLSTEILINVVAIQGNAKTEGTATEPTEIYINDADELMAFAALVNSGAKFANNVIITKDIDLAGYEWTPINIWDPENNQTLTITGGTAGVKISNMTVTGGEKLGFFGYIARDIAIDNITFEKANVTTSASFAGVVIGHQYGDVTLKNVNVINSNVATTATYGIRIGGLVGFSLIHDGATISITGCTVENTTVTGYHNVAGLVGTLMQYNANESKWTMTGNKVTNSIFNVTSNNVKYGSAFAVEGSSYPHNYTASNNYFTKKSNEQSGNTFNIFVSTADQLLQIANQVNTTDKNKRQTYSGITVNLVDDIDLAGIAWTPIGNVTSFPGNSFDGIFDGQGNTISNMTTSDNLPVWATAGLFGSITATATVKNVILENATVNSTHYAGGIVGYAFGTVHNCQVINSKITSTPEKLDNGSYDNGDKAGGIAGYMSSSASVTNCLVKGTTIQGYRDVGGILGYASKSEDGSQATTVKNNTIENSAVVGDKTQAYNYKNYSDAVEYDINEIIGQNDGAIADNNQATNVKIEKALTTTITKPDGDETAANAAVKEELDNIIADNKVANVTLPAGTTVTLPAVSNTEPNKDVTIKGNGTDTVLDATAAVATYGTKLTFEDMIIVFDNQNYEGFQHGNGVVFKNCTIKGTMFLYSNTEFIGCTFEKYDATTEYNVWTYGNDATFTNCTFKTGGKAILVYHENERHTTVTVENCTFTGDGTFTDKAAIEVGSSPYSADTTYDIIINNCTATGFVANKSTSALWGNKNSMDKDHLNVTIDGVDVY